MSREAGCFEFGSWIKPEVVGVWGVRWGGEGVGWRKRWMIHLPAFQLHWVRN